MGQLFMVSPDRLECHLGALSLDELLRSCEERSLSGQISVECDGWPGTILLESGLAFLGLGVQPPTPSWGNMIAGGRDLIVTAPWVALVPGAFLIATVLACTVIGDALRDRLAGQRAVALSERA